MNADRPTVTPRALLTLLALAGAGLLATLGLPAAAAAEACPNEAFRTGPSAALPDCRVYEMVTPPHKNASLALDERLSMSGQSVVARSPVPWSAEALGNGTLTIGNEYYLDRTAAGWTTTPLNPPSSQYNAEASPYGQNMAGVGINGGETLWIAGGGVLPSDQPGLWLEPSPGAPLREVGPLTPPGLPGSAQLNLEKYDTAVVGYASDFSHVLFTTVANYSGSYWPFDKTLANPSLLEYVGTASPAESRQPILVGLNNAGEQITECGTTLGGADGVYTEHHNSVSADGKTIFFTARAPAPRSQNNEGCSGRGPAVNELYARIEKAPGAYETVAISEPESAGCLPSLCDTAPAVRAPGRFVAGTEDGSRVVFETTQPLLEGAAGNNIYEYDLDGEAGHRVVRVSGGNPSSEPADVQGVVQVSEDGSHVYFVARGVLTTTPNEYGERALAGQENLYVYDAQTGVTSFIANTNPGVGQESADVTPEGRFLVFTSNAQITPDDTSTAQQVFEYDAQTGELVRISVGQGGYDDNGNTDAYNAEIVVGRYEFEHPASTNDYWENLTMSTDGSYVFFTSKDALVPQAHHSNNLTNIYEYHSGTRIGEGSVSLISDGQEVSLTEGGEEVRQAGGRLLGTDASGADVFFTTIDKLAPQDTDTSQDIYDARVDGGFPPPLVYAQCAGEECQGQVSAAPVELSPGSEFQAGGNPPLTSPASTAKPKSKSKSKSQGCKKGDVRKKGKCVKSKARKSNERRTSR